jgi:tRNA A37 N6-isopentenylltransferase MiaA
VSQTIKRTRNLARRQAAWFVRDPRIRWFDVGEAGASQAVGAIRAHLEAP